MLPKGHAAEEKALAGINSTGQGKPITSGIGASFFRSGRTPIQLNRSSIDNIQPISPHFSELYVTLWD